MGVEYDIRCTDCGDDAGIGDGCSKAVEEMRAILGARAMLEQWSEAHLDIELKVGYGTGAHPEFFGRHKGHMLRVMGDNGVDYTEPGS